MLYLDEETLEQLGFRVPWEAMLERDPLCRRRIRKWMRTAHRALARGAETRTPARGEKAKAEVLARARQRAEESGMFQPEAPDPDVVAKKRASQQRWLASLPPEAHERLRARRRELWAINKERYTRNRKMSLTSTVTPGRVHEHGEEPQH